MSVQEPGESPMRPEGVTSELGATQDEMDLLPLKSLFDIEGNGIAVLQPDAGAYGSSYQIDVTFTQESTTAGAVYPSVGDVDLSVQYGPNGTDYTGTLEQPAESDVLVGVQYGAGGTEFTGSATGGGGGFISIINE